MTKMEFMQRTKNVGLRIMRLVDALPRTRSCDVIGRQLLRSGTSIGANYRSACRARSTADMIAKLGIVEEETDETDFWIELLMESGAIPPRRLVLLRKEVGEILAMVVASRRTLKSHHPPRNSVPSPSSIGNRKSKIENSKRVSNGP